MLYFNFNLGWPRSGGVEEELGQIRFDRSTQILLRSRHQLRRKKNR